MNDKTNGIHIYTQLYSDYDHKLYRTIVFCASPYIYVHTFKEQMKQNGICMGIKKNAA